MKSSFQSLLAIPLPSTLIQPSQSYPHPLLLTLIPYKNNTCPLSQHTLLLHPSCESYPIMILERHVGLDHTIMHILLYQGSTQPLLLYQKILSVQPFKNWGPNPRSFQKGYIFPDPSAWRACYSLQSIVYRLPPLIHHQPTPYRLRPSAHWSSSLAEFEMWLAGTSIFSETFDFELKFFVKSCLFLIIWIDKLSSNFIYIKTQCISIESCQKVFTFLLHASVITA